MPVSYFLGGLEESKEQVVLPRQRMCIELARNFSNIDNWRHQEALGQMARALAAA